MESKTIDLVGSFTVFKEPILPVAELLNNIQSFMDNIDPSLKIELAQRAEEKRFFPQFLYMTQEIGITDDAGNYLIAELCQTTSGFKVIRLHENFCGLFWSFCYFVYYTYTKLYESKRNDPNFDGKIKFKSDDDFNAYNVWLFGKILKYSKSLWHPIYPNPYNHNEMTGKVNGLFTYGIIFILLHEIGHLVNDHFEKKDMKRIDKEKEADSFAIEKCIRSKAPVLKTIENGSVLALIALCLLDRAGGKGNEWYPNTEDRLTTLLASMNLKEDDITWLIAAYGLIIWLTENKMPEVGISSIETPKEYYEKVLKHFKTNLGR